MEPSKKIGLLPLIITFFIVAVLVFVLADQLTIKHINVLVVQVANLLLFSFSALNIYFQKKNINNPNPNAVIRGVMVGMFLKLFGLAATAVIYLFAAGENRSVNAVFVGMGLYIIYTWLEVRISLRLNPKNNAGN
jgi:ABC-type Fe3+-siderophore transport system permease subunit